MTEEQHEFSRFERSLASAVNVQHELRQEIVNLTAAVAATERVRDDYAQRLNVIEGIVANLCLREPESIINALRVMIRDDADKVAEALQALIKTAVSRENKMVPW